jgi:hypothetical protein
MAKYTMFPDNSYDDGLQWSVVTEGGEAVVRVHERGLADTICDLLNNRDALLRDAAEVIRRSVWRADCDGWYVCGECGARCDDWETRAHRDRCPAADVLRRIEEVE